MCPLNSSLGLPLCLAVQGMVDCIIYSAGIGENSSIIRRLLNKNFEVQSTPMMLGLRSLGWLVAFISTPIEIQNIATLA